MRKCELDSLGQMETVLLSFPAGTGYFLKKETPPASRDELRQHSASRVEPRSVEVCMVERVKKPMAGVLDVKVLGYP